jgi:hypothetical protein
MINTDQGWDNEQLGSHEMAGFKSSSKNKHHCAYDWFGNTHNQ